MLQKLLQSFGCPPNSKSSTPGNLVYEQAYQVLKAKFDALTAEDNSKLADEFFSLQDSEVFESSEAAEHCNNVSKNRYVDVLPFDYNRVKIRGEGGEADAYINASLLKSHESDQPPWCYIAAQGPLNSTIADFWKMVLQHDSGAVVMLTRAVETRNNKCADYFPKLKGETRSYGSYQVTTVNQEEVTEDIICRTLELCDTRTSEIRQVQHYHYFKWPDHGVPTTTKPIRQLTHMLSLSPAAGKNVVVHCSAGIGRTGAFCSIDIILKRLRWLGQHRRPLAEGAVQAAVDVRAVVSQLRQQRRGMVQTLDQYYFVYLVILQEVETHL